MCAQGEKVWFSQLTDARISNERKGKFDFEKSVKLTYNNPSSTFLRIALAAFEVASVERAKEKKWKPDVCFHSRCFHVQGKITTEEEKKSV